jgi:hypothetical protein
MQTREVVVMREQYRVSDVRLQACNAIDPATGLLAIVGFTVDRVRVEGIALYWLDDEQRLALRLPSVFSYQLRGCPYGPPLPQTILRRIEAQVLAAPEIKSQESSS